MKSLVCSLALFSSLPAFANDFADKIAYVLKDPSVAQAIDGAVADGSANSQKSWFKGIVSSETPSSCKGDRTTFVLLYGRTVQQDGKDQVQKCSQLVHFGDCNSTTGKVSDVEKSPRCKSAGGK